MAKTQGASIPQMYPLKGDHNLPEVSKAGMIQTPVIAVKEVIQPPPQQATQVEPQPQQQQQPVVAHQQLATNFTNVINPTIAVNPNPIHPTYPIAQPSSQEERETRQNLFDGNLPTNVKSAGTLPIPLNVKLTGKLLSFELELDDQDKWMINIVDRNRIRRQLLNKIKIDVNMVRRLLPKQVDLNKFLKNLEYKVIHDYKIPLSVKELRAEYQSSPWFQDIYKYVKTGFCRYTGHAKFAFKKSCEDYFLINDILFKLKYDSNMDEMTTVLCIPEKYYLSYYINIMMKY